MSLSCCVALAQRPAAPELPDGAGKELAETLCTGCHATSTITRGAGYDTPERWREVMASMMTLREAEAQKISEYLAEHFSENPDRRPTLVEGPTQIEITEWIVPTLGQRSRDPIEDPDGSI